ncbi:head-tail adaptor protein [Herbaspirillum huttiense]|uniref:phage head closure protein n=1 Tax=Herbaspirillum huttiense TaxID=863372 RepID=UPI0010665EA2|nr:phage head closure protein [Herbaspirillum huttiense]QBP75402.1 head-tail adaptor protein [Herbaspirillum huttiense]
MRAGQLNRRISLQRKLEAKNDVGDIVKSWAELSKTWARKIDISGRELDAAMSISPEVSVKFLVRYREDIEHGMRIVLEGKAYRVISALDKKGNREELQVYCTKGLLDGDDAS